MRISTTLKFDDFSVDDSSTLLHLRLKEKSLELTEEAESRLIPLLEDYHKAPHWSNGRDVETLAKTIYREQAKATSEQDDEISCGQISSTALEKAVSLCISMKGDRVRKI